MGVFWKIQEICSKMGTRIFKIDEDMSEIIDAKVGNPQISTSKKWANMSQPWNLALWLDSNAGIMRLVWPTLFLLNFTRQSFTRGYSLSRLIKGRILTPHFKRLGHFFIEQSTFLLFSVTIINLKAGAEWNVSINHLSIKTTQIWCLLCK